MPAIAPPLAGVPGIAVRRHHHRQRRHRARNRGASSFGQSALRGGQHQRGEIAPVAHHQHLAFGIAEAAIIFDQLRPLGGQHQPGIEHADIRRARLGHRPHGRARRSRPAPAPRAPASAPGPGCRRPCRRCSGRCRRRRRACDPARSRTGRIVVAVGDREEARFLAGQEFLDHHLGARPRRSRRRTCRRSPARACSAVSAITTPLPAARPSALITTGRPKRSRSASAACLVVMARISGGRDAVRGAQILDEALRAFELRRRPRWARRPGMPSSASARPSTSGCSGPTTTRPMSFALAKGAHRRMVGDVEIDQLRLLGDAGIAGRGVEPFDERRLRQLPRQRMLAPARSDQKHIHDRRP